ncbi:MAG: hypothetical protein AAGN15_23305 [Cyanobacteria bacterium J06581_3]
MNKNKEERDLLINIVSIVFGFLGVLLSSWSIFKEDTLSLVLVCAASLCFIILTWKMIHIFFYVVERFRQPWTVKDGILFNRKVINVAFRAQTVKVILDSIEDFLEDSERFALYSKKIGYKVGADFYKDLLDRHKDDFLQPGGQIDEKLNLWSQYDSVTGFGVFEPKFDEIIKTSDGEFRIQGMVTVRNSFLIHGRPQHSDKPYCAFMEGYIGGIIGEILDSEELVEGKSLYVMNALVRNVREIQCGCATTESQECKFQVSVIVKPTSKNKKDIRYVV